MYTLHISYTHTHKDGVSTTSSRPRRAGAANHQRRWQLRRSGTKPRSGFAVKLQALSSDSCGNDSIIVDDYGYISMDGIVVIDFHLWFDLPHHAKGFIVKMPKVLATKCYDERQGYVCFLWAHPWASLFHRFDSILKASLEQMPVLALILRVSRLCMGA